MNKTIGELDDLARKPFLTKIINSPLPKDEKKVLSELYMMSESGFVDETMETLRGKCKGFSEDDIRAALAFFEYKGIIESDILGDCHTPPNLPAYIFNYRFDFSELIPKPGQGMNLDAIPAKSPKKVKRKSISQKVRFEVFKRDSFKCQYCGASAPDAVLHVDHINPVSKGGSNDLLNLITSCESCNLGKGANKIDDNSVVLKQKEELDKLNEKRLQLEMMLEWRSSLNDLNDDVVNAVKDEIEAYLQGKTVTETGLLNIKKWCKKYSLDQLIKAIDASAEVYLKDDSSESIEEFFKKIPRVASVQNSPGGDRKRVVSYSYGILRNRFSYTNQGTAFRLLNRFYDLHPGEEEDIKNICIEADSWGDWVEWVELLIKRLEGEENA